jgi:hypothetical protein
VSKRSQKDSPVSARLEPTRRDRFLPIELLAISGGLAVFTGLIVLMATRELLIAGVAFGIAFIVSLVSVALFALAFKPNEAEAEDIHEQDAEAAAKAAERAQPGGRTAPAGGDEAPGTEKPAAH